MHPHSLIDCHPLKQPSNWEQAIIIKAFCSFPPVLGTTSTEKTPGKLAEMTLVLRGRGVNFEPKWLV